MAENKSAIVTLASADTLDAAVISDVIGVVDCPLLGIGYDINPGGDGTALLIDVFGYISDDAATADTTCTTGFHLLGTSGPVLSGTGSTETMEPHTFSRTISTTRLYEMFGVNILFPYVRVKITATSGTAADVVTAYASLIRGG